MIKTVPWPQAVGKQDGDFKLDRVYRALEYLGNPHNKLPFPIHIAGTNGKGSTIAFLEAILAKSGYTSHVYTSPNLICLNERFKICNQQIGDARLLELLDEVRLILAQHNFDQDLTFFEGLTVAAFYEFARIKADFSLIEVGLGGRFDATNVIPNTKIGIITSISMDHMEYLGDTIEKIASEKAGIVKKHMITIIGKQRYERVYDVVYKKHKIENQENNLINTKLDTGNINQNVYQYAKDFEVVNSGSDFIFRNSMGVEFGIDQPSLGGSHQYYNAAQAIQVAEIIKSRFGYENIATDSINLGITSAVWPARMQKLNISQFPSLNIVLDGAHNEDGIENLFCEINKITPKPHLIFGCLKRKDLSKIAKIISKNKNSFEHLYITNIHSSQEARNTAEISNILHNLCVKNFSQVEYFYEALQATHSTSNAQNVIIFGSLYLAGEVLEYADH